MVSKCTGITFDPSSEIYTFSSHKKSHFSSGTWLDFFRMIASLTSMPLELILLIHNYYFTSSFYYLSIGTLLRPNVCTLQFRLRSKMEIVNYGLCKIHNFVYILKISKKHYYPINNQEIKTFFYRCFSLKDYQSFFQIYTLEEQQLDQEEYKRLQEEEKNLQPQRDEILPWGLHRLTEFGHMEQWMERMKQTDQAIGRYGPGFHHPLDFNVETCFCCFPDHDNDFNCLDDIDGWSQKKLKNYDKYNTWRKCNKKFQKNKKKKYVYKDFSYEKSRGKRERSVAVDFFL